MIRARIPLMITMAGALAVSGCMDTTNGTGEDRNRTKEGALWGAGIGAVIGAVREDDDRLENAAVGAAIGGLIGAGVGSVLDRQEEDLRRQMGNESVEIVNTGNELIVTMPQDILFATDSAVLRSDLQRDLRALASNLHSYPDTTVEVIGHTDNTGDAGYNQNLSARRASSVATVLINEGVASWRIRSFGRGENEPVASNLTPEGRAQNRRVEIVIRPQA